MPSREEEKKHGLGQDMIMGNHQERSRKRKENKKKTWSGLSDQEEGK